jgi:vacuolar-type H+-ATPase subunit I/STV1
LFQKKTENKKMSLKKYKLIFKILIKFKTEVYTNVILAWIEDRRKQKLKSGIDRTLQISLT